MEHGERREGEIRVKNKKEKKIIGECSVIFIFYFICSLVAML